jgi:DNA adenine methylase
MTDEQHEVLISKLLQLKGMVILSGYDNNLYNGLLPWRKVYKKAFANGSGERKEVLWTSPNTNLINDLFSVV